jgi:DNA-binding NarL/FixJ family response regulator
MPRVYVFTHEGSRYFVATKELDAPDPRISSLTPAQREVLALLADGCSNADIAARRKTSPRTTANQVASLLRALGCDSRTELALIGRSARDE